MTDSAKKTHAARGYRKFTALCEAQNWRCCYCGTRVDDALPQDHPDRATTDHFDPKAHGGRNGWANEIVACWTCNGGRGTMDAMLYLDLVRERGRHGAAVVGRLVQSRADGRTGQLRTDIGVIVHRLTAAHRQVRAPQFGIGRATRRTPTPPIVGNDSNSQTAHAANQSL